MKRSILILGASSGLGYFLTKKFHLMGHDLFLVSRKTINLKKKFKSKKNLNKKVIIASVDLSKKEKIERLKKKIKKNFSHLDVVINCAAIHGDIKLFHENNLNNWLKSFEINFLSFVKLIHFLIPILKKKNSSIICLSGGGATSSRKLFSSYSSSKTAMIRFIENLSEEFIQEKINININAVAPGIMNTKLYKEAKKFEDKKNKNPKFTDMNKIFNLIEFLINPKNLQISGKIISAKWDNWERVFSKNKTLKDKNIFTLRRCIR